MAESLLLPICTGALPKTMLLLILLIWIIISRRPMRYRKSNRLVRGKLPRIPFMLQGSVRDISLLLKVHIFRWLKTNLYPSPKTRF